MWSQCGESDFGGNQNLNYFSTVALTVFLTFA